MAGEGEGVGTAKYDMTTIDEDLVKDSIDFMKKAKDSGKPFFLWHNTTRRACVHVPRRRIQGDDEPGDELPRRKRAWRGSKQSSVGALR